MNNRISRIPINGAIPESWEFVQLRELFKERLTKVSDRDYPPLSVGKMGVVPQLETAVKTEHGDNRKLVKEGDFAINSRSDRKGAGGISSYTGSVSLIINVLKPIRAIDKSYFNYLLTSNDFKERYYQLGHGLVSDLWTTKWDEMKGISVPFPPLYEQKQIAEYLAWKISEINQLINGYQKQVTLFEEYKQRIIDITVTQGIDAKELKDSGVNYIGKIPINWKVKRLRFLGTCVNGISKSQEYFGTGFPFVSYSDVYNNIMLPEVSDFIESTPEEQDRYSVRQGDVFFTRTSETIEEIAFSSVCTATIPNACFAGFLIRFRPTTRELITDYLKYYFRSGIHRQFFSKEMNIVTRASLSQDLLKNLPVLIPPTDEQIRIAKYIDEKVNVVQQCIDGIEKNISLLKEYKTSLISSVVTGRVDVRNVEIPEYETVELVDTDVDAEVEG